MEKNLKKENCRRKEKRWNMSRGPSSFFSFVLLLVLFCFVFCFVLFCFVLFCLVLSCLVLSCLVLSCLVLSCFVFCLFVCFLLETTEICLSSIKMETSTVKKSISRLEKIGKSDFAPPPPPPENCSSLRLWLPAKQKVGLGFLCFTVAAIVATVSSTNSHHWRLNWLTHPWRLNWLTVSTVTYSLTCSWWWTYEVYVQIIMAQLVNWVS